MTNVEGFVMTDGWEFVVGGADVDAWGGGG